MNDENEKKLGNSGFGRMLASYGVPMAAAGTLLAAAYSMHSYPLSTTVCETSGLLRKVDPKTPALVSEGNDEAIVKFDKGVRNVPAENYKAVLQRLYEAAAVEVKKQIPGLSDEEVFGILQKP